MGPSQVGAHTGTHTSDKGLFQKGLKKAWPENDTPAPPTAKVFFGRPTTQKGSKKSLRTQKGSKKSLRHWRPMRPSQMGTQTSDKGLFQKGLTKNLTRKRNTCPPTAKVFFGTSYHTKRVQKKPSDIWGPWGQVKWELRRLTRDYSRKVWKKTWPENRTPAPTLPRFFLERPTTQKSPKKAFAHKKGPKKAFNTGGPWGQVKWEPIRLTPAPTLPRFFWDVPPHKKGPKKPSHTKGPKKTLKWEPIRLTRDYPRNVWKKPGQNLPHEKGQKKAFWSKSEKRPCQPSKRVKKKPRRYRKKPSPPQNYRLHSEELTLSNLSTRKLIVKAPPKKWAGWDISRGWCFQWLQRACNSEPSVLVGFLLTWASFSLTLSCMKCRQCPLIWAPFDKWRFFVLCNLPAYCEVSLKLRNNGRLLHL